MDKQEKVELILEQMRYCIAIKDFIRTQIISKKISVRFFEKDEYQVFFLLSLIFTEKHAQFFIYPEN